MTSTNKFLSGIAITLCCLSLTNCYTNSPPPSEPVVVHDVPARTAAHAETSDSAPKTHTHSKQAENLNSATVNGYGG